MRAFLILLEYEFESYAHFLQRLGNAINEYFALLWQFVLAVHSDNG